MQDAGGVLSPHRIRATFIVPPREAGLELSRPAFSLAGVVNLD